MNRVISLSTMVLLSAVAFPKPVLSQGNPDWRLGIAAYTFHKYTLFETIEKTAELGLTYLGALSSMQNVSDEIPRHFNYNLSDSELRQVQQKLDEHGVRLITYYFQGTPKNEAEARKLFEFGRRMGIETLEGEPDPESLAMLDRLANEYEINIAIHNHGPDFSPVYWRPEGVLNACEGLSPRIGACADTGFWQRAGIDTITALRLLKGRVISVHLHDLNETGGHGHDVAWGTGTSRIEQILCELQQLNIRPTMIGIEYACDWHTSMPKIAESIKFYDAVTLKLAREKPNTVAPGKKTKVSDKK